MNPSLVLFAIETGVRLGHKLNEALVSSTQERPMLLPIGDLYGEIDEIEAIEFFDREENQALTAPGGPYAGFAADELIKAFKTLKRVDDALGGGDLTGARETIAQLHAFEQIKSGHGAPPALQQVLGELINVGVDYFAANPGSLVRDSAARRILSALVQQFDGIDFSVAMPATIVNEVMLAALETLRVEQVLLDDNPRLQAVLGGVTSAVVENLRSAASPGAEVRRRELAKRVLSAALLGSAEAVRGDADGLLPPGSAARPLIDAALRQVLRGIDGDAELFSSAAVGQLMRSALEAVAENAELFAGQALAQRIIEQAMAALGSETSSRVFDRSLTPALVDATLRIAVRHAGTVTQAGEDIAAVMRQAIDAVAAGLAAVTAAGGSAQVVLSKRQLKDVAVFALQQAARRPSFVLAPITGPGGAPLARILGSTMLALEAAPRGLLHHDDSLLVMEVVLANGLDNSARLLDSADPSLRGNPLYAYLRHIVDGVAGVSARTGCTGPGVLVDVVRRLLPLASVNSGTPGERAELMSKLIERSAALAVNDLDGWVTSANFPVLVEGLLRQLLWRELDLNDDGTLIDAARAILRAT